MARYSNVTTNFSGGLVTDHLVGRIGVDRMANSARKFTNFLPTLQGPASYRPGFERMGTDSSLAGLSASASVAFASGVIYRAVFLPGQVKVYDTEGVLKDTVPSTYNSNDLKDLRFSSEIDALYIAHPNHRPNKLTGDSAFAAGVTLYTADTPAKTLTSSDGFILESGSTIEGGGNWTLSEINPEVEPFLEPDTSETELRIEKDVEVVKIVTTDDLSVIHAAGSGANAYYIEYTVKGKTILGRVLVSDPGNYPEVTVPARSGAGTLGDPYIYTVYVDAVDFVTEITAATANLSLLDNAETTTSSIQEKQLEQEGVPDGEVHLRSDVDIFSNANNGTWIRINSENRSNRVIFGTDSKFNLTRWVKVTEYVGLETHPVDFFSGAEYIEEASQTHDYTIYESGSIYKAYGDSNFSVRDSSDVETGRITEDGNRSYVWSGGELTAEFIKVFIADYARNGGDLNITLPLGHGIETGDSIRISGLFRSDGTTPIVGPFTVQQNSATEIRISVAGLQHDPVGDTSRIVKTVHSNGSNPIVGNLTTAKSFEVVKCDPTLTVQLYDGSINTGGKLFATTLANTTVTEIANDIIIKSDKDIFDTATSPNRHIKGELPSGTVYAKILEYASTKQVRAKLINTVPRDPLTGAYENKGVLLSFNLGAWYDSNFPRTVAKYEQRRVYGGTQNNPNLMFFSRLGDEDNFAPTQDDKLVLDTDGITYSLTNVNAAIRWIKPGRDLIVGTTKGIFKLIANQFQAAISPKTIRIELVDEVGCDKDGVFAGTSVFIPDESNTELLEYKYDSTVARDTTNDVSKFIYPTFIEDTIKKVEFQNNPQPRLYVVTDSGLLYILTYHRQEDYYAWSKHEMDGVILDVTVLSKGFTSGLDQVWLTVGRGGSVVYERMFSEANTAREPTHYLDNATVINNFDIQQNATTIGDFNAITIPASNYNDGDTVSVVADGIYLRDYEVSGGNVVAYFTIRPGTTDIVLGTRYTGTLQMMYPTWNGQNKPAFGAETSRTISQKVFLIDSARYKQGIDGRHSQITLPNSSFRFSTLNNTFDDTSTLSPYTGFDRERPLINSQFGVEKIPELVQDEPYKTIFGSLVTKTDLK